MLVMARKGLFLLSFLLGSLNLITYANFRFAIGDKGQQARVTSFALKEDESEIVVAYANDVIKRFGHLNLQSSFSNCQLLRYSLAYDTSTLLHQFRGTHKAPILVLKWMTKGQNGEASILAVFHTSLLIVLFHLNLLCSRLGALISL
jgi:hypothetical protein